MSMFLWANFPHLEPDNDGKNAEIKNRTAEIAADIVDNRTAQIEAHNVNDNRMAKIEADIFRLFRGRNSNDLNCNQGRIHGFRRFETTL